MKSKRVALLDWDGTLSRGAVVFAWTKFLHGHGLMSDEAMRSIENAYADLDAGRIDYLSMVNVVTAGYARGLLGRYASDVSHLAADFAETYKDQIMWFAPDLIRGLKDAGTETVVITGSPSVVVEPLAKILEIDRVIGLEPVVLEGIHTAVLQQNTARPEVKQEIVESFAGCDVVLGAGDSAGDTPLLAAARVRLFIGSGDTPELDRIIRIPVTESPEAHRALTAAINEATSPLNTDGITTP